MPILKPKYESVRVSRPTGTKYAEAEGVTPVEAYFKALGQFVEEFRRLPNRDQEIIEIVGLTTYYKATVFEVPDEQHPPMM